MFHLEQHFCKLLEVLNALQLLLSSNERSKTTFPPNDDFFGTKSDIFTQPKVYEAEIRSLMCQSGLFFICLSLVHGVLTFEYVETEQHLLLEPSADKRKEFS